MTKKYINENYPHFLHGGDYNPEQWIDTKEIWDEDMRLMKEANCNEMTLGVFSWSTIEPQEGRFDFSFLDEMIEKIGQNGGKVILATPTSAAPRWLTKKYPEVIRVGADGKQQSILLGSNRAKFCYTSPKFREKVKAIDHALATRYSNNPNVLAWHLNNEVWGACYCENCQKEFRNFLKKKYQTVEKLNQTYWAKWSSGEVSDFDEIDPPPPSGGQYGGVYLDWQRFTDQSIASFLKFEGKVIKSVAPESLVTTNLMPQRDVNLFKLAPILDFASVDLYPYWGYHNDIRAAADAAWQYDYVRSIKQKPFVLMECAPGLVSWMEYNKLHRPGVDTLAGLTAVAHGSDSVCYFQFRKSRGACEQYHGAIVDHVGTSDTRVFQEVKRTGEILKQIDEIAGTCTTGEVALFYDVENRWALDDVWAFRSHANGYMDENVNFYQALWNRSVTTDIVNEDSDLSGYKLLILPMQYVVTKKQKNKLLEYVKNGGVVYATYMLGYANENGLTHLGGFPCEELKDLFGIWNEEIDSVLPEDVQTVSWRGKDYEAKDFCERIHLRGAESLATYATDFYQGQPCLTVNQYGAGKAYYQAFRGREAFIQDVVDELLDQCGITRHIQDAPKGVSAQKRSDGVYEYLFVENYSDAPAESVALNGVYQDMIGGDTVESVSLEPFSIRILKKIRGN